MRPNKLLTYFARGLLFVVPLSLTFYIIIISIQWLDSLIPVNIPGLGLIIILGIIILFGYMGSTLIARPFFSLLEEMLTKIPLVSIIYSSIKDLMDAFVGEKKKFNRPVLVTLNPEYTIQKPGFITNDDLSQLGLQNQVAVYLPHSYNFSGNIYIVPSEYVEPLDESSTNVMKFIISGGVSGLPETGSKKS